MVIARLASMPVYCCLLLNALKMAVLKWHTHMNGNVVIVFYKDTKIFFITKKVAKWEQEASVFSGSL